MFRKRVFKLFSSQLHSQTQKLKIQFDEKDLVRKKIGNLKYVLFLGHVQVIRVITVRTRVKPKKIYFVVFDVLRVSMRTNPEAKISVPVSLLEHFSLVANGLFVQIISKETNQIQCIDQFIQTIVLFVTVVEFQESFQHLRNFDKPPTRIA